MSSGPDVDLDTPYVGVIVRWHGCDERAAVPAAQPNALEAPRHLADVSDVALCRESGD